jgi:hypothetical protein
MPHTDPLLSQHSANDEDVAPALLPDGVLSIADLWS